MRQPNHPLLSLLEQHAQAPSGRPAVADQSLMLDYAALKAVGCGLSSRIAAAARTENVGILAPTSSAAAAAIVACWYAGRVPVPLNFLLAPEELAAVLRDAGLDLVLTIERFAPLVQQAGLKPLLLSAETLAPGPADPPAARGGDTAVILYTSGTSGLPKGVCLSFDNILSNARACIDHARITPEQVFLSVLPQFHSFGFTAMTVVPLVLGATVWYLPRFSPLAIVETVMQRGVTVFMGVASMFAALAQLKSAPEDAFRSLTLAVSGGEPLPGAVADAFHQRFGIQICEGYGLTETSPVVSLNTPWALRRGSVGRALPGLEVYAVDDDGSRLPAGTQGELVVAGHCLMKGYHKRPDETAGIIRDGRLFTGDVGYVDPDGYIFITGRAKEMIIIAGENVFPREIEAVLLEHPAVAEAAVIGARDDLRGELPVAFVIAKEGASVDGMALREFCRGRLAGYKVPREVHIMPDLPRGPTGKILKRALSAPAP